jgi:alkylated DNA repair dioxygenase AlkB
VIRSDEIVVERLQLDDASWVDVARDFLGQIGHDHDEVFATVLDRTTWEESRVFRYERWVDEPRLGGRGPIEGYAHPSLADTHRLAQHRYGVRFARPTFVRYRDERDAMALHSDRDMRWLDDTVIALLVLGDRRPFHLRPVDARLADDPWKGAVHDVAPGHGDLVVMGGACQAGWQHGVPHPVGPCGERISVQWRWTSGRGRPVVGASYRSPRLYSR